MKPPQLVLMNRDRECNLTPIARSYENSDKVNIFKETLNVKYVSLNTGQCKNVHACDK